jgi:hypothetical protein
MSTLSSINATQSLIPATSKKSTAQQTAGTWQQPAADTSGVAISQAARDLASQPTSDPSLQSRALMIQNSENDPVSARKETEQFANNDSYEKHGPMVNITVSSAALYANYEQTIAEKTAGQNQVIAYSLANPTSPLVAQNAYVMSHDESMNGASVGGIVSLAGKTPNDPISYSNGEPVTLASQAYFTKQNASYQNQVLELYNTEKAKGTSSGQIVSDIFNLQARQPDAFRAMMYWPPVAASTGIQTASKPNGAPDQYLNSGGQIVKS